MSPSWGASVCLIPQRNPEAKIGHYCAFFVAVFYIPEVSGRKRPPPSRRKDLTR